MTCPSRRVAKGTFTVVAKPVAAKRPATSTPHARRRLDPRATGGGSVGGGSWAAVERYYLRPDELHTNGRLGDVRRRIAAARVGATSPPLRLDAGISSKVSRPYAKKLAVNNMCTHFSGGNPGDRLRRAGYTSYRWAENLGCRSGNPYSAVLGSHLLLPEREARTAAATT